MISATTSSATTSGLSSFDYSSYHTFDDIRSWMYLMQQSYSSYVTVLNLGNSYENRSLLAMKISVPSNAPKKAFWLDSGVHAREWISISTVIFIAYSACF